MNHRGLPRSPKLPEMVPVKRSGRLATAAGKYQNPWLHLRHWYPPDHEELPGIQVRAGSPRVPYENRPIRRTPVLTRD